MESIYLDIPKAAGFLQDTPDGPPMVSTFKDTLKDVAGRGCEGERIVYDTLSSLRASGGGTAPTG